MPLDTTQTNFIDLLSKPDVTAQRVIHFHSQNGFFALNFFIDTGFTPIHHFIVHGNQNVDILAYLLEYVDVNLRDSDDNTPVMLAAMHQRLEGITTLLQANPNLTVKNKDGDTVLHLIADIQDPTATLERFGDLLQKNIYVMNNLKRTPLHIAVEHGHLAFFDYWVDANSRQKHVNFRHMAFCRGPDDESIIYTILRRLHYDRSPGSEGTVFHYLHRLAMVAPPELFSYSHFRYLGKKTPAELADTLLASKRIKEVIKNAAHIHLAAQMMFDETKHMTHHLQNFAEERESFQTIINTLQANLATQSQTTTQLMTSLEALMRVQETIRTQQAQMISHLNNQTVALKAQADELSHLRTENKALRADLAKVVSEKTANTQTQLLERVLHENEALTETNADLINHVQAMMQALQTFAHETAGMDLTIDVPARSSAVKKVGDAVKEGATAFFKSFK